MYLHRSHLHVGAMQMHVFHMHVQAYIIEHVGQHVWNLGPEIKRWEHLSEIFDSEPKVAKCKLCPKLSDLRQSR